MIACITVNLKYKLNKNKKLKIDYFIEERINERNYKNIIKNIIKNEVEILIIEEICLQEIDNKLEIIKFFKERKVKIILLFSSRTDFQYYLDNKFYNFIYLTDHQFTNKLCNLYNENNTISNVLNNNAILNKQNISSNLSKIKDKPKITYIIGISLDNKIYSTTFLINLGYYLNKGYQIEYYEEDKSLIDYEKLENFTNCGINYFKFKKFEDLEIELQKRITKRKNSKIFIIIDCKYKFYEKNRNLLLKERNYFLIGFTTDCLKVCKNEKYQKNLDNIKKERNIVLLNRKNLFDIKISSNIAPILSNKHNKKYIMKKFKI